MKHLIAFWAVVLLFGASQCEELVAGTFTAEDFKVGRLQVPISKSVEPNPSARNQMIAALRSVTLMTTQRPRRRRSNEKRSASVPC